MKKLLLILMICMGLVGCGSKEVKTILNDDYAKKMSKEEVSDSINDVIQIRELVKYINKMEYETEEDLFERFDNEKINLNIPKDTSSLEYIKLKTRCGSVLHNLNNILMNSPINTLEEYKTQVVNDLLEIQSKCDDNKVFANKLSITDEAWDYFSEIGGW